MAEREVELKKELKKLKNQEKKLDYLINVIFSSESEFNKFVQKNKANFELLEDIKKRISDIQYLLLSDTEKKEKEEYLKKLKNKFTPLD